MNFLPASKTPAPSVPTAAAAAAWRGPLTDLYNPPVNAPAPKVATSSGTLPSFVFLKKLSKLEKNRPTIPRAFPADRPNFPLVFNN